MPWTDFFAGFDCDRHSLAKCPSFRQLLHFFPYAGQDFGCELDHNYRRMCVGVCRFPVCFDGCEIVLCNCFCAGLLPMHRHWRNSDLETSFAREILQMRDIYPQFSVGLTQIHEVGVLWCVGFEFHKLFGRESDRREVFEIHMLPQECVIQLHTGRCSRFLLDSVCWICAVRTRCSFSGYSGL